MSAAPGVFAPAAAIRSAGFTTLGCKVNTFETGLIKQTIAAAGVNVDAAIGADLHIINTCTVTGEADRQARQAVRRAVRGNPDALVIVTGCYAQMSPEACAAIPGVDLVLGNGRKLDVHNLLPQLAAGRLPKVMVDNLDAQVSLPRQLLSGCSGRARAFMQVQQGCDQGCTFCIIHRARGPSRSLPAALVYRQARRLLLGGYRELVVCGVDLGAWGRDLAPAAGGRRHDFAGLMRGIAGLRGDFRLRLSSLDPAHLSPQLARLWGRHEKICPHLHLSMQSGSDLILRRMKRRLGRAEMLERVHALREKVPALTVSADIMTGFPTETESQFTETLDAVRELKIAWPHVFPYSARPGTPAARIPRQVPSAERRRRAAIIRQTASAIRRQLHQSHLGRRLRVLAETPTRARAANYITVTLPQSLGAAAGEFLTVDITEAGEDCVTAGVLNSAPAGD